MTFSDEVVASIVELSSGYPHFTHLLTLKCAEEAVADRRKDIKESDLERALRLAVDDAEGTLRRIYSDAVRSYGTEQYGLILLSAAKLQGPEFKASELRQQYHADHRESINQPSLNNYLKRLVSTGPDTVLRRIAKGVYRFNDPRMPSYIRIAHAAKSSNGGA